MNQNIMMIIIIINKNMMIMEIMNIMGMIPYIIMIIKTKKLGILQI